jgi:hypothetical protein
VYPPGTFLVKISKRRNVEKKCERRDQGTNFGLTGGARHLQKL